MSLDRAYRNEIACRVAAVNSILVDGDLQLGASCSHSCGASQDVGATAIASRPRTDIVYAP